MRKRWRCMKYLPSTIPSVDTLGCGLVSYAIPFRKLTISLLHELIGLSMGRTTCSADTSSTAIRFPAYFSPSNILITTQSGNSQRVQSFTLGEAFTISPRTVNDAHITLLRRRNNRGYATNDINANTIGVNVFQVFPTAHI